MKKDGKKTENVYANKCKEVKTRLHAFQYSCPSNLISNQSSFLGLRISECKFDGKHFDIRVAYQCRIFATCLGSLQNGRLTTEPPNNDTLISG